MFGLERQVLGDDLFDTSSHRVDPLNDGSDPDATWPDPDVILLADALWSPAKWSWTWPKSSRPSHSVVSGLAPVQTGDMVYRLIRMIRR